MKPGMERIDPSLRVPMLPRAQPMDLGRLGLARRLMRFFGWLATRNQPGPVRPVALERHLVVSADGQAKLPLRIHRPRDLASPAPVLLWIHGGGYVMGTAAIEDRWCARFAAAAGVVVAAIDYRLAPEHAFPVPLEDCCSALDWLARHGPEVGIDSGRIAIGGASAGGELAAALALLARDRDGPRPVFQLLNYPMLDDRTVAPVVPHQGEWVWGAASNRAGWAAYLGTTAPDRARVPARAESLAGLPPAWIGCGELDLFHPENAEYSRRLQAAGVGCEWVSVPGAYHGFDTSAPRTVLSQSYFDGQVRALRRALAA